MKIPDLMREQLLVGMWEVLLLGVLIVGQGNIMGRLLSQVTIK